MGGGQFFIAFHDRFFAFCGKVEECGAAVFGVGMFEYKTLFRQAFGDLHAGGIFDEQFAAEFFFVGTSQDGDVNEHGELQVFGKADGFDSWFGEHTHDPMEAGDEQGALGIVVEVGPGRGGWGCRGGGVWLASEDPAGETFDATAWFDG